VSLCTSPPVCL